MKTSPVGVAFQGVKPHQGTRSFRVVWAPLRGDRCSGSVWGEADAQKPLPSIIPALSPVEMNVGFSVNIYLNKLVLEPLAQRLLLWSPVLKSKQSSKKPSTVSGK